LGPTAHLIWSQWCEVFRRVNLQSVRIFSVLDPATANSWV